MPPAARHVMQAEVKAHRTKRPSRAAKVRVQKALPGLMRRALRPQALALEAPLQPGPSADRRCRKPSKSLRLPLLLLQPLPTRMPATYPRAIWF